jgi:sporulation protein YqfC
MIKELINYIKDSKFKIVYVNNSVDVINYDKILEVRNEVITLEKENKVVLIKGTDLKLDKLLDNEILITGTISQIEL